MNSQESLPAPRPTGALCQSPEVAEKGCRLLAEVVAETGADEATVWVLSKDGTDLEGALNHGQTPETIEQLVVPVSDSLVGSCMVARQAAILGPGELNKPMSLFIAHQTDSPVAAMMVCPVYVEEYLCGALTVVRTHLQGPFTAENLELARWKAFLAGLVLEWALRRGSNAPLCL